MSVSTDVRTGAFPTGSRTLEVFEGTDRLNRWIYDRFAGDLGRRVLELGSGIGSITQYLADRDLVVATDVEEAYLEKLRNRFRGEPRVLVRRVDLDCPDPTLAEFRFDSVIAVNVLEHIRDDAAVLAWLRSLVGRGGKVCLYVPALSWLYGSLDRALGHHRRYERAELLEKLERAGLKPIWCRWMNAAAMPGWLVSGRLMGRDVISPRQVAVYDRLIPWLRYEDRIRLPIGMNLTVTAVGV
jgi:SAM-dependent methyltransferase